MINPEKEGFNPEKFSFPDEDQKTPEKPNENEDKNGKESIISRRKFLKILGGAAVTVAVPEILQGEEKKKEKTKEKSILDKEHYVDIAKKNFEDVKKIPDIERRRDALKKLQKKMIDGVYEITIDDLEIETAQEKRIREIRKDFISVVSSEQSDQVKRLSLKFLYDTKMAGADINWEDLMLEKDDENKTRLLTFKDQLDQVVFLGGGKLKTIRVLNQDYKTRLLKEDKNNRAEKLLDAYYDVKTLKPYKLYDIRTEHDEEKKAREINGNLFSVFELERARRGSKPFTATFNIDPDKDKEFNEYLTKIEESANKKNN